MARAPRYGPKTPLFGGAAAAFPVSVSLEMRKRFPEMRGLVSQKYLKPILSFCWFCCSEGAVAWVPGGDLLPFDVLYLQITLSRLPLPSSTEVAPGEGKRCLALAAVLGWRCTAPSPIASSLMTSALFGVRGRGPGSSCSRHHAGSCP